MDQARSNKPFLLVGNHPCLDFINTEMIIEGLRTDLLEEPADLIDWLLRAQLIGTDERKGLRLERAETENLLDETKTFRTVLREMAERIVTNKPVPRSTVETINRLLRQRHGYPQLLRTNGRFEHLFHSSTQGPARLLALLADSASDLLCTADLSLVKKCRNNACVLYFYDTTKNHARQWCSMQLCGNRIKVAAHYRRKRLKNP
ncbi:MAG: ABATE domain-containing protein [Nitrospira sp.]|nr:ABATE domain-containing protein [Nitrospira sp.]